MPCCGKNRAAFAASRTSITRPAIEPVRPPGPRSDFPLRYKGDGAIVIRGPETGRRYQFSLEEPLRYVDVRDLVALRRTHLFD